MIRTQAEDIVPRIRTVVGRTKRAYVSSFCIRTGRTLQAGSAHLASTLVECLHSPRLRRIPYYPRHPHISTIRNGIVGGFLGDYLARNCHLRNLYQTEAPDLETGFADLMPVIFNRV